MPKVFVKPCTSQSILSDTPFVAAVTRPTGPMETPVDQEVVTKGEKATKKTQKCLLKPPPFWRMYSSKISILGRLRHLLRALVLGKTSRPVIPTRTWVLINLPLLPLVINPLTMLCHTHRSRMILDFPERQPSHTELSDDLSDLAEVELSSEATEKPEQTEDMNYRETVRSIRSFMGWNHIPTFDLSEPD